jgi:uncharacterized membrane protein (UPF0127 family)
MIPLNKWFVKGYRYILRRNMKKVILKIGSHRIIARVAQTKNDRIKGLTSYKQLPENHGMLFVFETLEKHCFWMKNTQIPLSIAFLRNDGTITKISDMQPYSLDKHCANQPVRYALEMNQDWFKNNKVNVGKKITNRQYFI